MLSPLKPSVPSASLLRFLRLQSEIVIGPGICARPRPRPRIRALEQFPAGSPRNSSNWVCPGQSRSTLESKADVHPGTFSRPQTTNARPVAEPLIISRNASTTRRPLLRRLFDLKQKKTAEYKGIAKVAANDCRTVVTSHQGVSDHRFSTRKP